jgi:phage minor structural protein
VARQVALIHILDKQVDEIIGTLNLGEYSDDEKVTSSENENTFDFTALKKFDLLQKRNRLLLQDRDGFFSEYIIIYAEQNSRNQKFIKSNATFTDLQKAKIIEPQVLQGATADTATTKALEGTEWRKGKVDYNGIRTIKIEEYTNPYSLLKRIASEFGLDLRFRVAVEGNKIVRYVDLTLPDDEFDGKEVVFGKDLIGLRRIEDAQNIVTALLVLGPEQEDGKRLTVLVEDNDALQRWGRNGQHLIEVYEPQITAEEVTVERLRTLGENALQKRIDAIVTYECQAAIMELIPGKEHEKIRLDRTLRIKDEGYTPPLYVEAKVLEIKEQPSTGKILDFKLGNYKEFSKADLEAQIADLKKQLNDKLSKLVQVSVTSSAGTVFKNGTGETDLTAVTILGGKEVDTDGLFYNYVWSKYDKNGNFVGATSGKKITVYAKNIDEKETYIATVENEGAKSIGQITISNVNDGSEGAPGRSVETITEYFLATSANSGVTRSTPGWTTTFQPVTNEKKYLWSYKKITYKNPTGEEYIEPVIIGVYGDKGDTGQNATSYWLVCNVAAIQKSMSGVYTPTTITVTAKSQTGTGSPTNYAGRFIILESTDGTSFTVKYTSTANEATKTYTPSAGIKAIKVQLYLAGGITTLLDEETIPILADVADMQDAVKNAQSTADGKNSLFYQATAPSTVGRKINDLWYDTDDGYKPYRFDGSNWIPAPFGNAAIANLDVGKIVGDQGNFNWLEAKHIKSLNGLNVGNGQFVVDENGNVKFAGNLEGASGTFGQVTVKDGDFYLEDTNSSTKYSIVQKSNLIEDHSFELVWTQDEQEDSATYFWFKMHDTWASNSSWRAVGTPMVGMSGMHGPAPINARPIFGDKAIIVNSANYVYQNLWNTAGNTTYTLSAFAKRAYNLAQGALRIEVYRVSTDIYGNTTETLLKAQNFSTVASDYKAARYSMTFTTPAMSQSDELKVVIKGTNTNWVHVDGVQLVENSSPVVYADESTTWDIINGRFGIQTWTDFAGLNGWQNYGAEYTTARYRQLSTREVVVTGMLKDGVVGLGMVRLPQSMWPIRRMVFSCMSSVGAVRVDVMPDGYIVCMQNYGGWVSIDGIRFFPDV